MAIYRLIGRGIRLHYPGRPEVTVMRPKDKATNRYLDSDEAPTLVEITGEEILFDLDFALAAGQLVPYTPTFSDPPAEAPVPQPSFSDPLIEPPKPARKRGR